MLTLGFTTQFYTLWNVNVETRYSHGMVLNGKFTGRSYEVTVYQYIQNLSMDYEKAQEKIRLYAGERGFIEDLNLRGHGSFEVRSEEKYEKVPPVYWKFTFGKLRYEDIRTATDVWQLARAMNNEAHNRTRVYARRRLLELNELVKYEWIEKVFDSAASQKFWAECGEDFDLHETKSFYIDVKRKYATKVQVERMEAKKREAARSGHFFTDGERVIIEVKEVERFGFDTQFGYSYVVKYEMLNGKMVKYVGASGPRLEEGIFVKIQATIKHSEYKGMKETKLQRIKIK